MAQARRVVMTMPHLFKDIPEPEKTRLKVAAYARVSTDLEEQEDSFERQVAHYTELIQSRPEWSFVEVYADPGISGTRAEKRPDFLRMIDDCRAGRIQKILVKSISRFARNTVDALTYIRELKDLGISVSFESENIDTLTPGGEVLLAILSAMAEQESRTISSNIKWAWQRRWQEGNTLINTAVMLGYRKTGTDENGHDVYEINEKEAEIVRRIYSEFVAGYSITQIAKRLEEDEIPTKRGKSKWSHSTIESILQNEKYTGNAILGKTYKPDVLSKKHLKSDGVAAPIYFVEATHPVIIEQELFELAGKELARRKAQKEITVGGGKYSSRYPFSGLLVCGECGSKMRRHVRTMGSGKQTASWGCVARITKGRAVCNSHHVNEEVLKNTYLAALNDLLGHSSEIVEAVSEGAELALEPENRAAIAHINDEIIAIQEAALELNKAKRRLEIGAEAYAAKVKEYSEAMREKEAARDFLQGTALQYAKVRAWLDTFKAETLHDGDVTTVNATTLKALVERIVIRNEGIEVQFKCGASIEKAYVR